MFKVIGEFATDPDSWRFAALANATQTHDQGFEIEKQLRVSFDNSSQGQMALEAVNPIASAAHYRLRPINLGGASWFTLEYDMTAADLDDIGQLVPYLDAACAGSVTTFAVLRLTYQDGRSEDVSSMHIELRRKRCAQSFPISLGDLSDQMLGELKQAALIFFFEARDVDIDLYNFSVMGIAKADAAYSGAQLAALRSAALSHKHDTRFCQLAPKASELWTGKTDVHRAIARDVYLDFEAAEGRMAEQRADKQAVQLGFPDMAAASWRNLEFRFHAVKDNGSIIALLHLVSATAPNPGLEAGLLLREYDADYNWSDSDTGIRLPLAPGQGETQVVVDVSRHLSDQRHVHDFGLMLFLPPEIEQLEIRSFEAFVFDSNKV